MRFGDATGIRFFGFIGVEEVAISLKTFLRGGMTDGLSSEKRTFFAEPELDTEPLESIDLRGFAADDRIIGF